MSRVGVGAVAATVSIAGVGLGCVPAANATHGLVVRTGQSIQSVVDRAKSGDVIQIEPGIYRGSIEVTAERVTLRGSGSGTIIQPSESGTENACAKAGHGLCVTGKADSKARDVRLMDLTVAGFKKNGVNATWADGLQIRGVTAKDNGQQGISLEKSVNGVFRDNESRNNGESGIFLANSVDTEGGALDTKGAVIRDNDLTGNRIGVVLRRVRNLVVENNRITGNCGGVFVVGDEGVPRGGALTVRSNEVTKNNKYCKSNGRLPFIQGVGILLTGAEKTLVKANQVKGNSGTSPMSGGIVLYSSTAAGVRNTDNDIRDNTLADNGPADLANRDTGSGNTFSGNGCRVSEPTGWCTKR